MNIFRPQKPYVFRPPRYSPLLAPLLAQLSRVYFLGRKFRVREMTTEGVDRVASLARDGHAILIAPNHADHADPHVLFAVGRRHGLACHFMAAREGFEGRWWHGFLLQRFGAFSIDREGADIAAFKAAVQILREARHPLVIFPEGEIYHHHEQLDPLNEGVATMALRAVGKVAGDRGVFIVPTALRYAYDDAIEATFCDRLSRLEQRITWKPRPDLTPVDRIYRLGAGLLAIKEVEFLGEALSGDLVDRIETLRNRLVEMVERKHLEQVGTGSIPERVKTLRGRIRRLLTNGGGAGDDGRDVGEPVLYDDLDTLFIVVQLYSYPGLYLHEDPSIHRIAETILKLEEDVLGEGRYAAARSVHVRCGEPIDVGAFPAAHGLDSKSSPAPLTRRLSDDIQSMLEELSAG